MTYKSRHISISIERPADQVYEFTANPGNLPAWASGLAETVKEVNGEWIAESPMGTVKIIFSRKNSFGILDHDVILPSGENVHNPMRVVPNNDGSELIFTLYRRPDMSDRMFDDDAEAVARDLRTLKAVLEQ